MNSMQGSSSHNIIEVINSSQEALSTSANQPSNQDITKTDSFQKPDKENERRKVLMKINEIARQAKENITL